MNINIYKKKIKLTINLIIVSIFLTATKKSTLDNTQSSSIELPKKSYKEKFQEFFYTKNIEELHDLLKEWELLDAKDPELYIAYFNYYVRASKYTLHNFGSIKAL